MHDQLVSIVVPIYKVEKYLDKCIQSIINQTYKNLEIILVDDGSPDNCGTICDKYAKIDSRIKVLHKKNDGVSNARNSGIEIASGDYLYLPDGDDFLPETAIEKLVNLIVSTGTDMVISENYIIGEDNIIMGVHNSINIDTEYKVYSKKESAMLWVNEDWGPWGKLYKMDVHKNVKFPAHKIHEDEAIMFQLINNCSKIVYTPEPLYYYVRREGSTTNSNYSIKKMDWLEAWINNVEYIRENFSNVYTKAVDKMLTVAIYNFDNLLKLKETEGYIDEIKNIMRKYYKDIISNKYVKYTKKIRVFMIEHDMINLYRKIYIK